MSKIATKRQITRLVGKAIGDFSLIEENDKILVALSGGKDSWSLLYTLLALQKKAPIHYDVAAVTLATDFDADGLEKMAYRLKSDSIPHTIITSDIPSIVSKHLTEGTNPCSFCSRLRRGALYSFASRNGWNKIALGHHLDDFIETLLLNMFFNGSIKGMSPKLRADNGANIVIRPLVYVREVITSKMSEEMGLPIVACGCIFQGMVDSRRHWVKRLLLDLETQAPDIKSSLLSSMGRVRKRHLFPDLTGTELH